MGHGQRGGEQPSWWRQLVFFVSAGRMIPVMSLVGLLAACHGGSGLSRDTTFDPKVEPDFSSNGLIVVGLRVVNEPVEKTFLGDLSTHSVYNVQFREVTADGYFGRDYRQIQVCDSVRALLGGIFSDCQPDKLQYKVLSVPPGRYTLEQISYKVGNTNIFRNFNSDRNSGIFSRRVVQNPSWSFTVDARSIIYIGDLNFFFAPDNLAAQMALERHDDLAAQALATYPNVHGQIIFHSATGGTFSNSAPSVLSNLAPGKLMPIEGASQ